VIYIINRHVREGDSKKERRKGRKTIICDLMNFLDPLKA
jgi:hypothetical protein